jgi:N,N'-diacetyllegionaminate synthase
MATGPSKARAEIIAELATAHGGDIGIACEMIHAAAEAGADTVKVQSYSLDRLNPSDPQAEWLRKAHLDQAAHRTLIECAKAAKVQFLSTPFDRDALKMLQALGLYRFKIASSEAERAWWRQGGEFLVSWPWGRKGHVTHPYALPDPQNFWVIEQHITAIPLYPTPLECVSQAELLDGWSDHTVGTAACLYALARGAKVIEVHFTIPGARQMAWDKGTAQLMEIRRFAESVATMQTGVSEQFRTRWSA